MSREVEKKVLGCRWKRLFKSQGKFASTKIKSRVCILHAYYYFLAHWFFGKYILNFKTTLTRSQKKNLRGPAIQIALKLKMSTAYCEKAAFHDCFFFTIELRFWWVINEHSTIITPLFSKGMCNGKAGLIYRDPFLLILIIIEFNLPTLH